MKRKEKILIALDFHPSATKVIEAGFLMAKKMDAQVILLHVKVKYINYSLVYKKIGSMKLESLADLDFAAHSFLEKSKQHIEDGMIETIVKEGDFAESIIATAKKLHIDLIILGSHSQKWLENIVMGSVTEEVLRQSSIPLLIIPTKKRK